MKTYREYIEKLKKEWIGKRVKYEGRVYNVVGIDYNGFLLIDKKSRYNETTAIVTYRTEVFRELKESKVVRLPIAWHNQRDKQIIVSDNPLLYDICGVIPDDMIDLAYRIASNPSPHALENDMILHGAYKRRSRLLPCRKDNYTACLWLESGGAYGPCIIYSRRLPCSSYVRYIIDTEVVIYG